MNRLRGLIAVFALLFLLSGISLLVLVTDDKNDLSSRASTGLSTRAVKPLDTYSQEMELLKYNADLWLKLEPNLYLNQNNSDTLRIYNKGFSSSSISAILGKNFTTQKLLGREQNIIEDWIVEKYSYDLFGQVKKVNLWKNSKFTALEVGAFKNQSQETIDFLKNLIYSNSVLGASTPDDSAQMATLVRPSVVMVLNDYCAELKFFSLPDFSLSEKVYPFCLTSIGSGFFVSEDGILATNGHIVKNLPQSSLFYGLSSGKLDNLLTDFLNLYFTQINKRAYTPEEITQKVKEVHASKEVLYQVGGLIADLNKKNILKFQNEKNTYHLQLGNQTAEVTAQGVKDSDGVIKATLLDIDYQESNTQSGFVSSDVALLKAETGSYPSLLLGNIDDAIVGSNLQVVGFPAAVMSTNALLDNTSVSEPTFTKGVVSAIKSAKGNQKKLIQTDAIINHGNSGGPALLVNGKVVGVATYGISAEDGNGSYNFLRDIQDIRDLASKQNLIFAQGEVTKSWQNGLANYWRGYFKYAQEDFKKVKTLYPFHPTVDKYLQSSETKANTVEDQTPKFTHHQRSTLIYLSGSLMSISLLGILIFSFFFWQQKKKNSQIPSVPTF